MAECWRCWATVSVVAVSYSKTDLGSAEMDTKHAQGTMDVFKDTTLQVQPIAGMLLAPYVKVQGPECQLAYLLGNTHTHLVYIKVDVP